MLKDPARSVVMVCLGFIVGTMATAVIELLLPERVSPWGGVSEILLRMAIVGATTVMGVLSLVTVFFLIGELVSWSRKRRKR